MGLGKRHELTEAAWEVIAPVLPEHPRQRGRPWADHRRVINGILWVLATGVPWRDAPERYGPWQTLYERFARWSDDGTWTRINHALLAELQRQRRIDWSLCCVDGSSVRALTAAAGARKKNTADARRQPASRTTRSRPGAFPRRVGQ